LVATNERTVVVSNQTAREQVRFNENLKPVADTENGHPLVCCVNDVRHDRGVGGNRAAPEVVAVRETTGENDRVYAVKVVLTVPQGNGFAPREFDGAQRVAIVERTGEGDNADAHRLVRHAD
jgi:hypothetical protein